MTNLTGGTADCFRCESEEKAAMKAAGASFAELLSRDFIVCNTCGNKRCPRATDHRLDCTGSNEPGQPGSAYDATPVSETTVSEAPATLAHQPIPPELCGIQDCSLTPHTEGLHSWQK